MITPSCFTESVLFSTIRIETTTKDGLSGVATGFLYQVDLPENRKVVLLFTNNHVISDAISWSLKLHLAKSLQEYVPSEITYTFNADGSSAPETFRDQWTPHPNQDIDLCAINFTQLTNILKLQGLTVYYKCINSKYILSDESLSDLTTVEDVIMVGYPIGLYDDVHNLPIVRSGITASHPSVDFQGKSQGVIDMACFPGSSGSPVILYNQASYFDKKRNAIVASSREALLGILYGGPQDSIDGEIIIRDIPMSLRKVQIPIISTTINLGYYIKAKEIELLAKYITARYVKK